MSLNELSYQACGGTPSIAIHVHANSGYNFVRKRIEWFSFRDWYAELNIPVADCRFKTEERMGTRRSKVEKKSSGNVTTLNEVGSSRTEDQPKDVNSKNRSNMKDSSEKGFKVLSSTAAKDGGFDYMVVDGDTGYSSNSENEYKVHLW